MANTNPSVEAHRLQRLRSWLVSILIRICNRERLADGLTHGVFSAIAGVTAYLPTQVLGLHEGFWAAITAVGVVQSELGKTRISAHDQLTGAAIGGLTAVVVLTVTGQHVASYALAVIVAMTVCSLLDVATAARLAGITATVLLLVPHHGSVENMMMSRIAEVGWGVLVAIVVVWLAGWVRSRLPRRSRGEQPPPPTLG
jgi:uncharacterized membrane protein YccC